MHRGVWGAMLGTTIAALAVLLSRLQGMPAVGFVEVAPSLWRFVHRHMFAGAPLAHASSRPRLVPAMTGLASGLVC